MVIVLLDAFETIVLPRTVRRPIRFTNIFFALSRRLFTWSSMLHNKKWKQAILSSFAPMALLTLIAFWALLIIVGFALMQSGLHAPMNGPPGNEFLNRLYLSGTTFFTVTYGDVTPKESWGRFLAIAEGGLGLAFLGLIIGYVPVLYGSFSRREITILLLDSKAGSNPTAAELLRRYKAGHCLGNITEVLKDWEVFSAQLLESYLSYPILAFYRSQHDDQSWLNSLCAIMDACALLEMGFEGRPEWALPVQFQARATFAMARHLVVDLSYVLSAEPVTGKNRLRPDKLQAIADELKALGAPMDLSPAGLDRLSQIRTLYEPYMLGLSNRLAMDLPDWIPAEEELDNWQTSAWEIKHF